MRFPIVLILLVIGICYQDALCGEYEMDKDKCFYFSCDDEMSEGSCLPLPSGYLPAYFTTFRASILFEENYKYRLRLHVFAYNNCEMPIWDIDVFSYKPLLRDSVEYENGTYIDAVFNKVDMTPLIDDLEYNQDLDCKLPLEKNVTFEVTGLNPEIQMCMFEMQGAPVDMFSFIRELVSYSITLDVVWTTDDTIMITNEEIGLLSNYLPATYLNMTRIGSSDCTPLKY